MANYKSRGRAIVGVMVQGESPGTTASVSYFSIQGTFSRNTSETVTQTPMHVAGTFRKASIRITANADTNSSVMKLRKNGADTALTITITALTTGTYNSTSDEISVAAGDLINWYYPQCATGNPTASGSILMEFVPT